MEVVMPQLGETVAEGKITSWLKSPGEKVEAGENLFEVETEKVTMEIQALISGTLAEVFVRSGETVPVGTVVAVIGEVGALARSGAADDAPGKAMEAGTAAPSPAIPSPAAVEDRPGEWPQRNAPVQNNVAREPFKLAPFAETNTPTENWGKAEGPLGLKVTPLARRLIGQYDIDIRGLAESVKSKGAWRIGKAEVDTALHERSAGSSRQRARDARIPPPEAPGQSVPFNNLRRQTGQRLQRSWQNVPHVFQASEVDFAAIDRVRRTCKADFEARHGVRLTYLPFVARAVCIAIRDFPRINSRIEDDGLIIAPEVNLGIAVDLSHNGLVVPVVRNADKMTTAELAESIERQVEKARSGKLLPDDLTGCTYSISNNGTFGTLFTAPIVNLPQVAILSTDAVRKKPVVIEGEEGDSIAIHPVGIVAQSFDHRAFDGAYSAAFLAQLKHVLEMHDWAGELAGTR